MGAHGTRGVLASLGVAPSAGRRRGSVPGGAVVSGVASGDAVTSGGKDIAFVA